MKISPRYAFLLTALILAAGISFLFAENSFQENSSFVFEVTIQSSSQGIAQIFYDIGNGLREGDSARVDITKVDVPVLYRFQLPEGNYRSLRFDPIDREATVVFSEAKIVGPEILNSRLGILKNISASDFKAVQQVASLKIEANNVRLTTIVNANDPILELPLDPPLLLKFSRLKALEKAGIMFFRLFLPSVAFIYLGFTFYRHSRDRLVLFWRRLLVFGRFSSERFIQFIRRRMGWLSCDRMVKLLTAGIAAFATWIAIRYAGQPILESYGFRQTQTALSAFWIVREGWQLAYQTPVAGYPWSIPFEFPLYQSLVALVVQVSGFRLEPVGRLISFAFLLACAWPAFGIVRRLALPKQVAWVFCALLWSSPTYLFWGRTFMIETAALFFAFAAVPYALDLLKPNPRWQSMAFCSLFATLAALQKITTGGPVIIVLGCIWLIVWWRRAAFGVSSWKEILSPVIAFGIPILVAYIWVHYSDMVKVENPFGSQLTSAALRKWNLGTLQQKLAFSTYKDILWNRGFVLNASGPFGLALIVGAVLAGAARLRIIIAGGAVLFVLPILIFTNLHLVHKYYQAGCVLFLIGILAVAVAAWLPTVFFHPAIVPAAMVLLVINNLVMFNRDYGPIARKTIDASSTSTDERALAVGETVRRATPPDSGIVVFGNDWNSDIAFYSQRKSFTVPIWFSQYDRVLAAPARFLGNLSLGGVVICAGEKGLNEQITQRFETDEWLQMDVQGCRLVLPKGSIQGSGVAAALRESELR